MLYATYSLGSEDGSKSEPGVYGIHRLILSPRDIASARTRLDRLLPRVSPAQLSMERN
jgi:hypothetical protein